MTQPLRVQVDHLPPLPPLHYRAFVTRIFYQRGGDDDVHHVMYPGHDDDDDR